MLAAIILTLTACNSNKNDVNNSSGSDGDPSGEITKGRYIETDITPPVGKGHINYFGARDDGSLDVIFTEASDITEESTEQHQIIKHFNSKDGGKTWDSIPTDWAEKFKDISLSNIMVDNEGSIVFTAYEYEKSSENLDSVVTNQSTGESDTVDSESVDIDVNQTEGEASIARPKLLDIKFYRILANGEEQEIKVNDVQNIDFEKNDLYFQELYIYEDKLFIAYTVYPVQSENSAMVVSSDASDGAMNMIIDINTGDSVGGFESEDVSSGDENMGQDHYTYGYNKNKIIRYGSMSSKFKGINIDDGSDISKDLPKIDGENNYFSNFAFDAEGNIYTSDWQFNISRIVSGGSILEKIIDGNEFISATSDSNPNSMTIIDETIYIYIWGTAGQSIIKMDYDSEAINDPAKSLTIFTLSESESLRNAIAEIRKKDPDISIKIDTPEFSYEADSYTTEMEDALRKLNTEILAGKGPDLILLDGTPFESYIDKGILADLSEAIGNESDYVSSVINSFKTDKGLFAVPARFKVPALMGGQEVEGIKTLQDLVDAIKQNPAPVVKSVNGPGEIEPIPAEERAFLYALTPVELFSNLYPSSAPAIFDGGSINKENLNTFLTAIKEIYDHNKMGDISEEDAQNAGGGFGMGISTEDGKAISAFCNSMFQAFGEGQSKAALENYVSDTIGIMASFTGLNSDPKLYAVHQPGLSNGVYIPSDIIGVVESSQKKDLALDFVRCMLSESAQNYYSYQGSPVRNSSIDFQRKVYDDYLAEIEKYGDNPRETFETDLRSSLFDNLETPYISNEVILTSINDVLDSMCKGDISVDDAVNKIIKDSEIYLAEKD